MRPPRKRLFHVNGIRLAKSISILLPAVKMIKQRILLCILASFCVNDLYAMVFDNRFFPLIQHPYLTVPDHPSHSKIDGFATTSDTGVDDRQNDIGVPGIFGP